MATNLLTARQVAEQLAISRNMVYSLAARGDLPSIRMGRAVRFDQADVDTFRNACRQERRQPMPRYPGPARTVTVRTSIPGEESDLVRYFRAHGVEPKKIPDVGPQRRKP